MSRYFQLRRKPLAAAAPVQASFIQPRDAVKKPDEPFFRPAIEPELRRTKGGGSTLPEGTRQFMESSFDADFSKVRVHVDGTAAAMSHNIGAKAFTHGNDIYFNKGQYDPHSRKGQRLLAHELTHVVQQNGSSAGVIQRAEVDDRSSAGLQDIRADINKEVNKRINIARAAAGSPLDIYKFMTAVKDSLGAGVTSPIEHFVRSLPEGKRKMPPDSLAGTKYSGAADQKWMYKGQGAADAVKAAVGTPVGPSALVNGISVGGDKLGHFFNEGFTYFAFATRPNNPVADPASIGRHLEIKQQGLATTGVYSNADLAANLAGMQFYKDLIADPAGFKFDIANYITDQWNEQANPSYYDRGMGAVVWSNLLSGIWRATLTTPGSATSGEATVLLSVSPAGAVTGTYERLTETNTQVKGSITGTVIPRMGSVTGVDHPSPTPATITADVVTGVNIHFNWSEGTASGKGVWESVNEQLLQGSWGTGGSAKGSGEWQLKPFINTITLQDVLSSGWL